MQHYVNIICDEKIDTSGKLDESIFPNMEQNISSQGVRVITIPLERELIQKEADNMLIYLLIIYLKQDYKTLILKLVHPIH